jgi:hypothetical protein
MNSPEKVANRKKFNLQLIEAKNLLVDGYDGYLRVLKAEVYTERYDTTLKNLEAYLKTSCENLCNSINEKLKNLEDNG